VVVVGARDQRLEERQRRAASAVTARVFLVFFAVLFTFLLAAQLDVEAHTKLLEALDRVRVAQPGGVAGFDHHLVNGVGDVGVDGVADHDAGCHVDHRESIEDDFVPTPK
jgi:hypothetical protein